MKRNSVGPLGETELEILNIVWTLESASVADVLDEIRKHRDVAYTTVMTVMRKLADKGYLQYREDGKTYIYSAARPADDVRGNLLADLVEKVFLGSGMELVRSLVKTEHLTNAQRAELRELIASMDEGNDGNA